MSGFEIILADIRHRAQACLVPPPVLPLSSWIEANVTLPEGLCAVPGPLRLYPYQAQIADAIGDPEIERVTLQKAARIGFSALVAAAIGHYCVNDPSPILCLLPVESDGKDFVKSDIEPMFAASPALRGVLSADAPLVGQRGKRRDTMLSRFFPGGSLKIVASHAPRNLRRHTARVLFLDEVDAMAPGDEGSPIDLATRRTLTFADRKIVMGSTPLDEETSNICRAYEASDQRIWEVPCPACGAFHNIGWADIEWPPGEPDAAAFRCPHCGDLVDEPAYKAAEGRWRATRPEVRGHAGFRLSALSSTLANARWGVLAAEFLAAKDDPETLKVFVNTTLGEPWRSQGDDLDEGSLLSRVEDFGLAKIPPEVLVITVGADVQDDRVELSFVGWDKAGTAYVLAHQVAWGPITAGGVWQDLDDLLKQRWQHPHGGMLGVDACIVDAGDGGIYDTVLKFAEARAARRIWAGKGVPGFARPAFAQAGKLKGARGGQRLYLFAADAIKALLFARLKRGQTIRFSDSLDENYFDQLCSERLVTKFSRGQPTRFFERIPGKRAEALDGLVMAYSARQGLALNLDSREAALKLQPSATPRPNVIRSRWMTEGRF